MASAHPRTPRPGPPESRSRTDVLMDERRSAPAPTVKGMTSMSNASVEKSNSSTSSCQRNAPGADDLVIEFLGEPDVAVRSRHDAAGSASDVELQYDLGDALFGAASAWQPRGPSGARRAAVTRSPQVLSSVDSSATCCRGAGVAGAVDRSSINASATA